MSVLPRDRQLTEADIAHGLTRYGHPTWNDDDFLQLLSQLNLAAPVDVAKEIAADVGKVRDELKRRSIDSTRRRRELRVRLGNPQRSSRTLDPALVRRFSRSILVDLPDRAAREQYLTLRLPHRPACQVTTETIKLIAERSSGMSIANLESIIEAAARQTAKTGGELTGKLLEEAFETLRYGEARFRSPAMVQRTACHEAGHAILYWLTGRWPAYVTVVARGDHGGYMAPNADDVEQRGSQTRDDLLARIRVSLGGRAAEQLVYGQGEGLSTGAAGDLEHTTSIARQMVCRYGMDDQFGLLVTPELMKYEAALSSPMYVRVNEAASKILQTEMDRTRRLLEENRRYLEAVTQALIAKERLTTEDLQRVLPETPLPAMPPSRPGIADNER